MRYARIATGTNWGCGRKRGVGGIREAWLGVAENTRHDLGTDLFVAARDERLFDLAPNHRKTFGDRLWGTESAQMNGATVEVSDEAPGRQRVRVGPGPVKGWGGPSSAGAGHRWRDAVIAHRSGA